MSKTKMIGMMLVGMGVGMICNEIMPFSKGFQATDSEVRDGGATVDIDACTCVLYDIVRCSCPPKRTFPLIISPGTNSSASADTLMQFIESNAEFIDDSLLKHGALLFRGWDIDSAMKFQRVAQLSVLPDTLFDGIYLGTSPRLPAVDGTQFVYTASEIPGWVAVSPHLEMSFKKSGVPSKICFYADTPNQGPGGETPLVDFRQVWRDMRDDLREKFDRRGGVRYVRHYFSAQKGGAKSLYPWTTHPSFQKSWEDMFHTNDKKTAARLAEEQGFTADWVYGDADVLRLTHRMNATRSHPVTGALTWNNHFAVLHSSGWISEYSNAFHRVGDWRFKLEMIASYAYMKVFTALSQFALGSDGVGTQVTFGDGSSVSSGDVEYIRSLIWRNAVVSPWQQGDVAYIDNYRIAHGRQPFKGFRRILTTWVE